MWSDCEVLMCRRLTGQNLPGPADRALRPIGLGQEHAGPAPARAARPAPGSLGLGDHPAAPPRRAVRAATTSFCRPREFEAIRGELLESAEVHGHCYGTPAEPVREALAAGNLRDPGDRRPRGASGPREGARAPS